MKISKNSSKLNKFLPFFTAIIFTSALFIYYQINTSSKVTQRKKRQKQKYPKLELIVKKSDYRILKEKRDDALKKQYLFDDHKTFVPAKLKFSGQSKNVEIRLKGDLTDHIQGEYWSFRVKMKGDQRYNGLKNFSVQVPSTRKYFAEWLSARALKKEGLLSLETEFVELWINGKKIGPYLLQEHFDSSLMLKNKRRKGVILKFNAGLVWKERFHYNEDTLGKNLIHKVYIQPFDINKVLGSKVLTEQFEFARDLLLKLVNREVHEKEVLDYDKWAKYFALIDLLGGQHSTLFTNIRFYFNPISSKLEPLASDFDGLTITYHIMGEVFDRLDHELPVQGSPFINLWDNQELSEMYLSYLNKFSSLDYIKDLLQPLEGAIQFFDLKFRDRSQASYLDSYNPASIFNIRLNAKKIRQVLNPPQLATAIYHENKKSIQLKKHAKIPFYVAGYIDNQNQTKMLKKELYIRPYVDYVNSKKHILHNKDLNLPIKSKLDINKLLVKDIHGKLHEILIKPWKSYTAKKKPSIKKKMSSNEIKKLDFIVLKDKKIIFKRGKWKLDKLYVFPENYHLLADGGVELNFTKNGGIVSYSRMDFSGKSTNPIKISNGSLIIIGEKLTPVNFDHVYFDNMKPPEFKDSWVSGGVTLYDSYFSCYKCQFNNSQGEDSLNLISSYFKLSDSLWSNSYADAFDSDYSDGEVIDSKFFNIGNDAIDLSMSKVKIINTKIKNARDKGVSAGEASNVDIFNLTINSSKIGIVSKDSSHVKAKFLDIKDVDFGAAAYQKKMEFGGGLISVEQFNISNFKMNHFLTDDLSEFEKEQGIYKSHNNQADIEYLENLRKD